VPTFWVTAASVSTVERWASEFLQNFVARNHRELELISSVSSNFVCPDVFLACKSIIWHLLAFQRANVLRCRRAKGHNSNYRTQRAVNSSNCDTVPVLIWYMVEQVRRLIRGHGICYGIYVAKQSGYYSAMQRYAFNPVKSSGHYMYRQFNIQQYSVLHTQCIYLFCVNLRTNSYYFPIQH
jgi:hypothetical protein